ncbi:hypothetical protein [Thermomonas carbonis]|uniref:Uncharacterized protein n=1 Tax=Thermomonas carbonis TaxID=1463158 RepID=A0A7G9SU30_9GAMM|nr:hypothetical protein [Thermomonas carbonis]QNN71355.1 hypothetical protein H9L16_07340 [Thermomonas carbonis]
MARENIRKAVLSVFAMALCFGHGSVSASDDIPTLDAVIAQADSVQTFYAMLLPPIMILGPPIQYDQIDPVSSEESDCERLQNMTFMLGCSASGLQERDTLRSKNSYAAGSSMYQLLEYQARPDTGLWAASDFGSALNAFELEWAQGGDLQRVSEEFFVDIAAICNSQFASSASQENVNACIRAGGQFLVEMANFINPQTRNTWVDEVLADTLQIRPTWSGVRFSFSYNGVSSSFGFDSIPAALPSYKKNLFKDWGASGCERTGRQPVVQSPDA